MGTRGSQLALVQANWVIDSIKHVASGAAFEIVIVSTSGDRQAAGGASTATLGDGIFVKEIQRALLEDEIDMAVHSLKDVPTEPAMGLIVAAVPQRADPSEALVGSTIHALKPGARVGTGSLRRAAQLKRLRKDLQIVPIRGNVPTRVEKARGGSYEAVMVAAAGLARLNIVADEVLNPTIVLPAPGQGALAIEVRENDGEAAKLAGLIHDPFSQSEVVAERTVLRELGGGCLLPVAAYGRIRNGGLLLDACITSPDGSRQAREHAEGDPAHPLAVGKAVARALVRSGARQLLAI